MEYSVLSILKKGGNTEGARVTDGNKIVKMSTSSLKKAYLEGYKFNNAIVTKEGYVRAKSGSLPVEELVTLYHGSIGGIAHPIKVNFSSKPCDFGQGFYLGEMEIQAKNRVCNSKDGYLYKFDLNLSGLTVYSFRDYTLWALYIGVNRGKINATSYKKLSALVNQINSNDVIIGLIADDKIAESYNDFLNNNITDIALAECLKEVKYGNQYVIKNQKCIENNLYELSHHILSKDERKESLSWGRSVKENLDNRLVEVKRKYRRSGKFLDEILEEYK